MVGKNELFYVDMVGKSGSEVPFIKFNPKKFIYTYLSFRHYYNPDDKISGLTTTH